MLKIRFFRTGKKNQAFFKIVVTDKRKPSKGGRFLEQVGFYNPLTKEKNLKTEQIKYWLSVGAKPSDTVHNLLIKEGILKGKKIAVHKKKKAKKEEVAPAAAPVGAVAGAEPAKKTLPAAEEKPAEVKPVGKAEKPAETKEELTKTPEEKPETKEEVTETPKEEQKFKESKKEPVFVPSTDGASADKEVDKEENKKDEKTQSWA